MRRTKQLMSLLGHHNHTFYEATATQLTLYELGALIAVAGNEAGFDVYSEYAQTVGKTRNGNPRFGKMDCAWFRKGSKATMQVAWEIDGRDVSKAHLHGSSARIGNNKKFWKSEAKIQVQALYSGLCSAGSESTQTRIRESRLKSLRSGFLRRHPERAYHADGLHARKDRLCNAISSYASKPQVGQTKPRTRLLTNTAAAPTDP
jgi:hypothetical protein